MKYGARQRRNRRRDEGGGVSRCQRCPCPGSRGLLFPALRTLASCECETQYLLMDAGWQQGRQHLRAPQGRAIARAALPCTVHALGEALRPATPALALVPGARRALRHDARPFPTTSGTLAAAPPVPVPRTTTQPSPAQPSSSRRPDGCCTHPQPTSQSTHPDGSPPSRPQSTSPSSLRRRSGQLWDPVRFNSRGGSTIKPFPLSAKASFLTSIQSRPLLLARTRRPPASRPGYSPPRLPRCYFDDIFDSARLDCSPSDVPTLSIAYDRTYSVLSKETLAASLAITQVSDLAA